MRDFLQESFLLSEGALGRSLAWESGSGGLDAGLLAELDVDFDSVRSYQTLYQTAERRLVRLRVGDDWRVLVEGTGTPGRQWLCYRLLTGLGVPTLPVYGMAAGEWGHALLIEDVAGSAVWRAAGPRDAGRWEVGRALGRWYRRLHEAGRTALDDPDAARLPREIDLLTPDSLRETARLLGLERYGVWALAARSIDRIRERVAALPQTLVYNDFSIEHLALMDTEAMFDEDTPFPAVLFDFGPMGVGPVYADVRNACYNLGEEARTAFLDEYAPAVDPLEKILDRAVAPLVALHVAARMDRLPEWAGQSVGMVLDGELEKALGRALDAT